jgi:hypothetical protein
MLAEVLSPVSESGLADEATQRLIAMAVDRRDREKSAAREQALLAASHGRQMLALATELHALESDALVKSANLTTFARLQLTQLESGHAGATRPPPTCTPKSSTSSASPQTPALRHRVSASAAA